MDEPFKFLLEIRKDRILIRRTQLWPWFEQKQYRHHVAICHLISPS